MNTLASMNGMHPGDPLRAGQKIRFSAARRRFDPISFTLSEQGEKALASDEQRA